MMKLLLFTTICFFYITSYAQLSSKDIKTKNTITELNSAYRDFLKPSQADQEKIDEMPEYFGGEDSLIAFLSNNIKYPKKAIKNNVSGRVLLSFIINKEGDVCNIEIIKHVGYGCDEEAVRVCASMPKWKPAKIKGNPVATTYFLPIQFLLSN